MAGKRVEWLIKSVATYFVQMALCIDKAFPRLCLKPTPELVYCGLIPLPNWTGCTKRSFGSGIEAGGGERLVPLDPLLLVEVDIINRSFTSQDIVLKEVAEAHLAAAEWAASFIEEGNEKEGIEGGILVLKVRLKQSMSDTQSARKRTAPPLWFQPLGYQKLVSWFCATRGMDLSKKKEQIAQA